MNCINADDFGLSLNVNEAIKRCFTCGLISNASLMVNCDYVADAMKWSFDNGFNDAVGLHLNLSFGKPLLDETKESFLCKDGLFSGVILRRKYFFWLSRKEKRIIYNETEAQILKFLSYGNVCLRLDSHRHIHTRVPILKIVLQLCKKHGIKYVRPARNVGVDNWLTKLYHSVVNARIRRRFNTSKYFCSLDDYLKTQSDDVDVEIMVHPSLNNDNELYDMYGKCFCELDCLSKKLL